METVSLDAGREGAEVGRGSQRVAGSLASGPWGRGEVWVALGSDPLNLLFISRVLGAAREPLSGVGQVSRTASSQPVTMCYIGGVSEGLREP